MFMLNDLGDFMQESDLVMGSIKMIYSRIQIVSDRSTSLPNYL